MPFSCQHRALCAQKNPAWGLGRRQAPKKSTAYISWRPPLPGSPSVILRSTNTFHFVLTFWQFPTNKHLALLHNSALLLGLGSPLGTGSRVGCKNNKKRLKANEPFVLFFFPSPAALVVPLHCGRYTSMSLDFCTTHIYIYFFCTGPKDASYASFNRMACKAPGCNFVSWGGAVASGIVALDLQSSPMAHSVWASLTLPSGYPCDRLF